MTAARNNGIPAYVFLDNKKKMELNQTKSRVSSLSSFFTSNSVDDTDAHEIFGFRRFAKNYFLGYDKSGRFRTSRHGNPSIDGCNGDYYSQVNGFSQQVQFKNPAAKKKLDQEPSTKTHKLNVNGEMVDYELDAYGVPQRIPDLFKEDNVHASIDGENAYVTSSSEDELLENNVRPKVIIIGNIPSNTGIGSILSQVCGGPLEKIAVQTNEEQALKRVELDFCTINAARSFMKYGRTNMFKINGKHLSPEWRKTPENKLSKSNRWEEQSSLELQSDFCRCLIMKKYINSGKGVRYSDLYKQSPLEPLDISEIKQDFEVFGDILEITPVVSRKLCISINFFAIESAVKAMKEYEDPTSVLHKSYFHNWAIWYGKDITDRPCVVL